MDYSDNIDLMDDDCDIQGFHIDTHSDNIKVEVRNMIPLNQFVVFTVIFMKTNSNLGTYFTFGDAYDRISEIVKGARLVEVKKNPWTDTEEKAEAVYHPEMFPDNKYIIINSLLTYHPDKHIVTYDDMHMNKDTLVPSMLC